MLKDFLQRYASEVLNMLTTEFDLNTALEVRREEALEEGEEKGRDEVIGLLRQGYTLAEIEAQVAARKQRNKHVNGRI
jgi:hypothetical protein